MASNSICKNTQTEGNVSRTELVGAKRGTHSDSEGRPQRSILFAECNEWSLSFFGSELLDDKIPYTEGLVNCFIRIPVL